MALKCVRTVFFEMVRCSAIQFALRPWANRSRISSSRADRPYTGLDGSHNEDASPPSCAATKGAPSASCERGQCAPHVAAPPAAASPPSTEAFVSLRGAAPEAPETDAPPATEPFAAVGAAVQARHAAQASAERARAAASLSTERAMIRFRSFSGNTYTSTSTTRNASAMPTPMRTMPST